MIEKVKVRGIPFKGRIVADTEWRIAEKCWEVANSVKDIEMQKENLDQHYRRAMVLLSAQNVEKCVIVSKTIPWSEF